MKNRRLLPIGLATILTPSIFLPVAIAIKNNENASEQFKIRAASMAVNNQNYHLTPQKLSKSNKLSDFFVLNIPEKSNIGNYEVFLRSIFVPKKNKYLITNQNNISPNLQQKGNYIFNIDFFSGKKINITINVIDKSFVFDDNETKLEKSHFAGLNMGTSSSLPKGFYIPPNIKKFDQGIFDGFRIASDDFNFLEGNKIIYTNMFSGLTIANRSTRDFTIPKTVISVEERAFSNSHFLNVNNLIDTQEKIEKFKNNVFDGSIFHSTNSSNSIIGDQIKIIPPLLFKNTKWQIQLANESFKNIEIIKKQAFKDATILGAPNSKTLNIFDSLKEIGDNAFEGADFTLAKLLWSQNGNLFKIGDNAFKNANFGGMYMPQNISIGKGAFTGFNSKTNSWAWLGNDQAYEQNQPKPGTILLDVKNEKINFNEYLSVATGRIINEKIKNGNQISNNDIWPILSIKKYNNLNISINTIKGYSFSKLLKQISSTFQMPNDFKLPKTIHLLEDDSFALEMSSFNDSQKKWVKKYLSEENINNFFNDTIAHYLNPTPEEIIQNGGSFWLEANTIDMTNNIFDGNLEFDNPEKINIIFSNSSTWGPNFDIEILVDKLLDLSSPPNHTEWINKNKTKHNLHLFNSNNILNDKYASNLNGNISPYTNENNFWDSLSGNIYISKDFFKDVYDFSKHSSATEYLYPVFALRSAHRNDPTWFKTHSNWFPELLTTSHNQIDISLFEKIWNFYSKNAQDATFKKFFDNTFIPNGPVMLPTDRFNTIGMNYSFDFGNTDNKTLYLDWKSMSFTLDAPPPAPQNGPPVNNYIGQNDGNILTNTDFPLIKLMSPMSPFVGDNTATKKRLILGSGLTFKRGTDMHALLLGTRIMNGFKLPSFMNQSDINDLMTNFTPRYKSNWDKKDSNGFPLPGATYIGADPAEFIDQYMMMRVYDL